MKLRDWLIFEDIWRDAEARAAFDAAVVAVNLGVAQVQKLGSEAYPANPRGFVIGGRKLRGCDVLEYAIQRPSAGFNAIEARAFTERMRQLLGWGEISYTLRKWVDSRLQEPYFVNEGHEFNPKFVLKPGIDPGGIPSAFFEFSCYVAIGELKYGPSYASVYANRIFDWATALGSDLPARLKKHGTGELPREFIELRDNGVTAKANDALAVIRLTLSKETEDAYRLALDYLVRLLTTTDFPRSYAIEFRGPTKAFLPIKGLPKKGIHQIFACAAAYPGIHPLIEHYARAAMHTYEWYTNLEDEDCAMPGTFAVFALGMAGPAHAPLVLDYLRMIDGEHQSIQARFVEACVDAQGFSPEALAYLVTCAGNIQDLRHRKTYPALIANRESLAALLALRDSNAAQPASGISALRANLTGEPIDSHAWHAALYAIWGDAAIERDPGRAIIDTAPPDLRPLYEQVFAER